MSHFKKKLTAFTAMLAFLSVSGIAAYADTATNVGGYISKTDNMDIVNTGSNRVDVNLIKTGQGGAGAVGQVDWRTFNVGKNQQVNFGFGSVSQTIINRVLGGQQSQILGKLTNSCLAGTNCATSGDSGKVILINPAGMVFGAGSVVDLNSFTASTFDIRGIKNLADLDKQGMVNDNGQLVTAKEYYRAHTLNGMSPTLSGSSSNIGSINFDSTYTQEFDKLGITPTAGSTNITLQGATFDHNNGVGQNTNKFVGIVSDNITYKDSIIKTGDNFNALINGKDYQSHGSVKLVTADGVTFGYSTTGYGTGSGTNVVDSGTVARNITIDNSGLNGDVAIESGNILIQNGVWGAKNANSNTKIANSFIRGWKLMDTATGDIVIKGGSNLEIDNSRLSTANATQELSDGTTTDSRNRSGNRIYIQQQGDVTINNSTLLTAGTTANESSAVNSGGVTISSYGGNTNVADTQILADGNIKITAGGPSLNVSDSLLQAKDSYKPTVDKNVYLQAANEINVDDSIIDTSGNISAYAINSGKVGNVNFTGKNVNGENTTSVVGKSISIAAGNTKFDNATLRYENGGLDLYGITLKDSAGNTVLDGNSYVNNVTIANDTTISDRVKVEGGYSSSNLNIETNGDLILDNASMQRTSSYNLTLKPDDGTAQAQKGTVKTTKAAYNNLTLTSTKGNVMVKNGSNANAQNITVNANAGNVTVQDASQLNANVDLVANAAGTLTTKGSAVLKGGNNVTAQGNELKISDNSTMQAGNNLNLISNSTIKFGNDSAADTNIGKSAKLSAGKDINVQAKGTNADIIAEKADMTTLTYGNQLTFNAARDNKFTSTQTAGNDGSLKSVNVNYIAGNSNNFTTDGDIQFVDSKLQSKSNNITTTKDGADVILNNLTIASATANAKDTVTRINAKGNVTTKDVTGTYGSDKPNYTYPQSVSANRVDNAGNTVLDLSNTKLIVRTEVDNASDAYKADHTTGSVDLNLKNANNKDAGLDIVAKNKTYDENALPNEGPEVHLHTVDSSNRIAVSRIVTDKLFLDKGDKLTSSPTELTAEEKAAITDKGGNVSLAPQSYIEVKDYMGFSQDNDPNGTPDEFDYTGSYNPGVRHEYGEEDIPTHEKHTINYGDDNDFILVYTKPDADCPDIPPSIEEPDVLPDPQDPLINQIKLPKEYINVSKQSAYANNTSDPSANIAASAARIELADSAEMTSEDDDKDEYTLE